MLNNQQVIQSPEKNLQPWNFQLERQKITKFLNNANLKVGFATVLTSCWCWCSNCVHLQWEATQSLCPARCHRGHSVFVQSVGWKLARTQYMLSMCTYLQWDAPPAVTFSGIGNIEWCQPASSVGFYIFGSDPQGWEGYNNTALNWGVRHCLLPPSCCLSIMSLWWIVDFLLHLFHDKTERTQ